MADPFDALPPPLPKRRYLDAWARLVGIKTPLVRLGVQQEIAAAHTQAAQARYLETYPAVTSRDVLS